ETALRPLPLGLGKLDEALPEGGLPRGAVVEISAPYGLARAGTLALAACASAQSEARARHGEETAEAWCAWLDPTSSLFAPAVAAAGVDLERLLIVRPGADDLAKVASRVAASGAFSVVVIDLAGVPGARVGERLDRWVNQVRRLALAVEGSETVILLLTDAYAQRSLPLPVALRLEVDRAVEDRVMVRVAKDRRGRVSPAASVPLPPAAPLQKSA
ncbi:MAG: recombinase A, partial [Byssovorax sp.]